MKPTDDFDDSVLPEAFEKARRVLERHFGLPQGFLTRLLDVEDWTYVLQLHALMESTVARIVCEALPPSLHEWARSLNLQGGRGSLTGLASELNLLSKAELRLIAAFSRLRADLAHGVEHTNVHLGDYLRARPNVLEELAQVMPVLAVTTDRGPIIDAKTLLRESPRNALYYAIMPLLDRASEASITNEYALRIEAGDILTTEDGRALVTEDAPDIAKALHRPEIS